TSGRWLVCLDRRSGAVRWKRAAQRDGFGFAVSGDRVFCVDYRGAAGRRADDAESQLGEIVAFGLSDGEVLWGTPVTVPVLPSGLFGRSAPPLDPQLAYSAAADVVLFTRNEATVAGYRGTTGELLWARQWLCKERGAYTKFHPPVVLSDRFVTHPGFVVDLRTGEQVGERLWRARRGCPRALGCVNMVLVRDGVVTYFDLVSGEQTLLRGIRSGCTASHIPAGGVVVAPHYMRHCNCNYPLSFSAAFVAMPEVFSWDVARAAKSR
ncbi:MAG: PQQ-like beta-propeller repeat protein, partial [Verrucomicrobiae bacterium]|nr:PQQ-like beta-propeller repeat protein [Verrucomicrobiae bacterium]